LLQRLLELLIGHILGINIDSWHLYHFLNYGLRRVLSNIERVGTPRHLIDGLINERWQSLVSVIESDIALINLLVIVDFLLESAQVHAKFGFGSLQDPIGVKIFLSHLKGLAHNLSVLRLRVVRVEDRLTESFFLAALASLFILVFFLAGDGRVLRLGRLGLDHIIRALFHGIGDCLRHGCALFLTRRLG